MQNEKYCEYCGAKIPADAEFCGNCGKKVEGKNAVDYNMNGGNNAVRNNAPAAANPYQGFSNSDNMGNFAGNPNNYPQPKKKRTALYIGMAVVMFVVFAFIGMAVERVLQNSDRSGSGTANTGTGGSGAIATSVPEEEKVYVKGTFTDTTYESEVIGIRYNASEGWALATESEHAQLPQDNVTTWEMESVNSADGSNILIAAEKLPLTNITVDMYINSLKNTLSESVGISVDEIRDNGTYTIAGETYTVITYNASVQNGGTYRQTFYLRKINTHMVTITVTAASSGVTDEEILSHFVEY